MLFMALLRAHESKSSLDTASPAEIIGSRINYTTLLVKQLSEALTSPREAQIIERNYEKNNSSSYKISDDIKVETTIKTSEEKDASDQPVEIQFREERDELGARGIVVTPSEEVVLIKKQLSLFKALATADGSVTCRMLIEESGLEKSDLLSRLNKLRSTLNLHDQVPIIRGFYRIRNLEEDSIDRRHYETDKHVRIIMENTAEDPDQS